jgi:hypothetical protein
MSAVYKIMAAIIAKKLSKYAEKCSFRINR